MRLHLHFTPSKVVVPFPHLPALVGAIHKWLGAANQEHDSVSLYSFSWLNGSRASKSGLHFPSGAKKDKERQGTIKPAHFPSLNKPYFNSLTSRICKVRKILYIRQTGKINFIQFLNKPSGTIIFAVSISFLWHN